jgi:Mor family transcriptional regulator
METKIDFNQLPEEMQLIYTACGEDVVKYLMQEFGGGVLYIPKMDCKKSIVLDYLESVNGSINMNGKFYLNLAKQFGISTGWSQKLIKIFKQTKGAAK